MRYQEFEALLGLLTGVLTDPRTGGLMLLLVAAAICDYRTHKIPNALVLSGALVGAVYTTLVPPVIPGTPLFALSGLLVGLLLFLPLHLLGMMGAADVKLLAMIGTFLGPIDTFYSALASMIVGGFLAISWAMVRGRLQRTLNNLAALLQFRLAGAMTSPRASVPVASASSVVKLPYGVPIALGTIGYVVSHQLGLL